MCILTLKSPDQIISSQEFLVYVNTYTCSFGFMVLITDAKMGFDSTYNSYKFLNLNMMFWFLSLKLFEG